MPYRHKKISLLLFSAGLLAASWASSTMAQPVIDWVTPPVWLQTETENTSAQPGTTLTKQAWVSTGRGGKAMVRLGREQVEIGENSLWEWTGQDDGSGGNAVQGEVRVSKVAAKSQAVAENPSVDQPVRLYQNAPWMLVLDVGSNQSAALGLVNFLRNSGYPVSEEQRVKRFFGDKWQIWLNGFASSEAAMSIGANLIALAPGILSTVAQHSPLDETAAVKAEDTSAEVNNANNSRPALAAQQR